MSLGTVSALCAADARREARRLLGADRPFSACKVSPKLGSFAETFLEDCAHRWKPKTLEAHYYAARSIARSTLGAKRVNTICRSDVVQWFESLPGQCPRRLSVLSSVMEYAETLGYRLPDTNPCAGLRRKKIGFSGSCPNDQDYKAIDRALAAVADSMPNVTTLLLVLMLTGSRRGEIENLRWSEIDKDVAILQDSKTGAKTIQLPAEVRFLLQNVHRRDGDPYVFGPGSRRAVRVRLTKFWASIRQSIGRTDLRIHDLRHGYGTKGLELGESLHTMSKLLGHADIESTMGYSHPSWQMLVSAARRVSANMERRLNAKKDQRVPSECGRDVAIIESAPDTWPMEVTIDHPMMRHVRAYRNQSESLVTFCTAQKIDPVQFRNALRLFQDRRRELYRIACKEKARSRI